MPTNFHCEECRAIVDEIHLALAGDLSSRERRAEVQANLEAFKKMLLGSEQAEAELFSKLAFRAKSPEQLRIPALDTEKMRQAFRRLSEHKSRTGHLPFFQRR
jgi:hypothetical protein